MTVLSSSPAAQAAQQGLLHSAHGLRVCKHEGLLTLSPLMTSSMASEATEPAARHHADRGGTVGADPACVASLQPARTQLQDAKLRGNGVPTQREPARPHHKHPAGSWALRLGLYQEWGLAPDLLLLGTRPKAWLGWNLR